MNLRQLITRLEHWSENQSDEVVDNLPVAIGFYDGGDYRLDYDFDIGIEDDYGVDENGSKVVVFSSY